MAALLGNLIYAGLQTLLTTQASFGSINAAINLYSINSGQASTAAPDVALFQPAALTQSTGALGGGIGYGCCTGVPLLFTRTGSVTVWYQPNTTSLPGDILVAYMHSAIR